LVELVDLKKLGVEDDPGAWTSLADEEPTDLEDDELADLDEDAPADFTEDTEVAEVLW
jgi:hypothetical protein